jgi:hypothetical protein
MPRAGLRQRGKVFSFSLPGIYPSSRRAGTRERTGLLLTVPWRDWIHVGMAGSLSDGFCDMPVKGEQLQSVKKHLRASAGSTLYLAIVFVLCSSYD